MKVIDEIIYKETKKRLQIMKKPDYVFPTQLNKLDKVVILVGIISCLLLICSSIAREY